MLTFDVDGGAICILDWTTITPVAIEATSYPPVANESHRLNCSSQVSMKTCFFKFQEQKYKPNWNLIIQNSCFKEWVHKPINAVLRGVGVAKRIVGADDPAWPGIAYQSSHNISTGRTGAVWVLTKPWRQNKKHGAAIRCRVPFHVLQSIGIFFKIKSSWPGTLTHGTLSLVEDEQVSDCRQPLLRNQRLTCLLQLGFGCWLMPQPSEEAKPNADSFCSESFCCYLSFVSSEWCPWEKMKTDSHYCWFAQWQNLDNKVTQPSTTHLGTQTRGSSQSVFLTLVAVSMVLKLTVIYQAQCSWSAAQS